MGAGDGIFVSETLRGMGLAGAVIIVLMFAVASLVTAIVYMQRHANKVYGYRLAERDTINKALTDSTNALSSMLGGIKDRNDITEELSEIIAKQAQGFEVLSERVRMQYDWLKEEHIRLNMVVTALSESQRQIVAMLTDVRNGEVDVKSQVDQFKKTLSESIIEVRTLIANIPAIPRNPRRRQ